MRGTYPKKGKNCDSILGQFLPLPSHPLFLFRIELEGASLNPPTLCFANQSYGHGFERQANMWRQNFHTLQIRCG